MDLREGSCAQYIVWEVRKKGPIGFFDPAHTRVMETIKT